MTTPGLSTATCGARSAISTEHTRTSPLASACRQCRLTSRRRSRRSSSSPRDHGFLDAGQHDDERTRHAHHTVVRPRRTHARDTPNDRAPRDRAGQDGAVPRIPDSTRSSLQQRLTIRARERWPPWPTSPSDTAPASPTSTACYPTGTCSQCADCATPAPPAGGASRSTGPAMTTTKTSSCPPDPWAAPPKTSRKLGSATSHDAAGTLSTTTLGDRGSAQPRQAEGRDWMVLVRGALERPVRPVRPVRRFRSTGPPIVRGWTVPLTCWGGYARRHRVPVPRGGHAGVVGRGPSWVRQDRASEPDNGQSLTEGTAPLSMPRSGGAHGLPTACSWER